VTLALTAVAAALLLVAPPAAGAREDEAASAERRDMARVVEIRVSGDAAALSRVKLTARELLLRLDVEPSVKAIDEPETSSEEPQPMVIAYVDLRNPSSPSIDIEDGATRQELTRRTLSDVSSLETGVEGILHVLYLAVESRLQVGVTARPSSPPPAAKKPDPKPAPRKPQRSVLGFDLGPMFRLSSLGGSRFVPGGGVVVEPRVDLGRSRAAGLLVSGAWHATSELTFDRGAAELRPIQVRIVPTLDLAVSSDVSGCLGLGAGLDVLEMTPTQSPERGVVRPPESALDPVLTGLIGARVPIAGRVFLSALASLDLDLAPTVFVAREGGESHALLVLPRLRPGFSLALSFTAAGVRRFLPEPVQQ
jgi:hypothetical protein